MQKVIIADDRTEWMKVEDRVMACFTRCHLYKTCSSHHGTDCKRLGGTAIPVLRGGNNGKQGKAKKAAKKGNKTAAAGNRKRSVGCGMA